jgi:hypothetical protein
MTFPHLFFDELKQLGYKLKGEQDIQYHLGGDFFKDPDGTLCWGAKTYIKRLLNNYQTMFGVLPTEANSPVVSGDHPELDESEEVNEEGIRQYQSLIGALQWSISLCRMDIFEAVMTLGRF